MGIKQDIYDDMLAEYELFKEARRRVLQVGQTYKIGQREVSYADLQWINSEIKRLQQELLRFGKGIRIKKVTFRG